MQQNEIFVRAYALPTEKENTPSKSTRRSAQKWPQHALIFDTETRITADQSLTFGVFRICELKEEKYRVLREGLLYADDLPPK
jgi:hypothetical protein